jgi:Tfp pilus assembly protein PilF
MDEGTLSNLISVYESGRLDEAASLCQEILGREPDQLEATYLLGRIQLDRSDSASAVAMLRRAVKLAPDWPEAHANLGTALFMRGKIEEATHHMRQACLLEPENAEAQNNLGVALRSDGREKEAEEAFLRALELRPDYPEALCNLGGALQAVGRHSEAMERFGKALALGSQNPEVLLALGEACLAAGELDAAEHTFGRALAGGAGSERALAGLASVRAARSRAGSASECVRIGAESLDRGDMGSAETAFRQALAASPEDASALEGLAIVLQHTRRPEQAIPILEGLLLRYPTDVSLLNKYGAALRDVGRRRDALAQFRRALELDASYRHAVINLAYTLTDLGEADEALVAGRRAVEVWPNDAEAHVAYGVALAAQSDVDFEAANSAFNAALRLDARSAAAYANLGVVQHRLGNDLRAVRYLRRALAIDGDMLDPLWTLSAIYVSRGKPDAGEELLRRAVASDPDNTETHARLAVCLLAREQYEEGWNEYENRVQVAQFAEPKLGAPKWRGEPNPAGTLFVYAEQALGDNIQFVRYLHMAKGRWQGRIIYCPYEALAPLFQASGLPAEIVPWRRGAALPAERCDAFISLMSLPWLFRTDRDTIPANVPYLHAPEDSVARWRERLDAGSELRVGLVWSGRRADYMQSRRSCNLDQLAPLAGISGVRFYSLQFGTEAKQLKDPPEGLEIVDLGEPDWLETAAIMRNLDLLISIDTATAHLAGALGLAVWNVVPYGADWRWQMDREDSPWYPTMRLFRQPKFGAWNPAWERVAAELRSLVESGRSPGG